MRLTPNHWLGLYVTVCALCLVWPGYQLIGARVEPRVLGVPFALFWHALWMAATFVVLVLFHRARRARD